MRLIDSIKTNILELNSCNKIRNISGSGFLSGHLKIDEETASVVWGILLKFRDGERSINAYWNGLERGRSLSSLVGKSLVLVRDENPQEEDFGYYCGSHKHLEWLRGDFIRSNGNKLNVNVKALGNFDDDVCDFDEGEAVIFEGVFDLIFRDIRLEEYNCSSLIEFKDKAKIRKAANEVVEINEFYGPYYEFGEPYAKKGYCWFELRGNKINPDGFIQ